MFPTLPFCYTSRMELRTGVLFEDGAILGRVGREVNVKPHHSISIRFANGCPATGDETIDTLKTATDKDWLRTTVESDDQEQEQQQIAQQIAAVFESIRQTRLMVRDVTAAKVPERGRARRMYEMIPEQEEIDIKDLILQMMSQVDDPSQALDASLESLVDLFRQNCIQIKVKRRYK